MIASRKHATIHELQTVYSLEDAYDMLEIVRVDNHNDRVAADAAKGDR